MNLKSCWDDECNQKSTCFRWHGAGEQGQQKHGIDPDGEYYCNYFITKDLYEKILTGTEMIISQNPD